MSIGDSLAKNPMILIDDATNLIAYSTVTKLGVDYPESVNQSIKRWKSHASRIMHSTKAITKKYYHDFTSSAKYAQTEIHEVDSDFVKEHGYDPKCSTVNIIELLSYFNNDLIQNGKLPVIITGLNDNIKPSCMDNTGIDSRTLTDLTTSIINIVKNIIDREGKITVETFDAIFVESMINVRESIVTDTLPEIKKILRDELKFKVTKGRPSAVTSKKVLAGICLADSFKGVISSEKTTALIKEIKDIGLLKPDRAEVIEIFKEYRNK